MADHPDRRCIHTDAAPVPAAPYSQAVVTQDTVYTAGQIGLDPATGSLVSGGVEAEARQVLRNLQAVLHASGSSLEAALKVTCYLADISDFGRLNRVYEEFFSEAPPARTCFAVAGLPKDARVEMEAIALRTQ